MSSNQSEILMRLGWNEAWARIWGTLDARDREPARVLAYCRDRLLAHTAAGELWCRPSGGFRAWVKAGGMLPCAGDWVALRRPPDSTEAIVDALLPRRSAVVRQAAGRESIHQALAANVDWVFLVMGLDRDFNPARMERLAAIAWASGATPVAVLTKTDLVAQPGEYARALEASLPGVSVHCTSAVTGGGIEGLATLLAPAATGVFIGSSGAGKTTLLNRLVGHEVRRTAAVRAADGRGRHTTSLRELFLLPGGGCLIDTPGLREVGLPQDEGLEEAFADLSDLAEQCRFRDCSHRSEPGCAIKRALAEGSLSPQRYESYLRLRREAQFAAARADERTRRERSREAKALARLVRAYNKERRRG